jgi:hypothetical protein
LPPLQAYTRSADFSTIVLEFDVFLTLAADSSSTEAVPLGQLLPQQLQGITAFLFLCHV